jgi:hypothetical protein
VLPQKPPLEQHVPNVEPLQVLLFLVPQTPSVEMAPEPVPQVPKPLWQPAPQWSLVLPQKPPDEQQSPKVDPLQVFPFLPQLPSVEMFPPLPQVPKLA